MESNPSQSDSPVTKLVEISCHGPGVGGANHEEHVERVWCDSKYGNFGHNVQHFSVMLANNKLATMIQMFSIYQNAQSGGRGICGAISVAAGYRLGHNIDY
jgi:hypothetical protein